MAKKPKPRPDDDEQSQRFVETAKQLGADESGKSFEQAVSAITKNKPVTKIKKKRTQHR